MQGLGQGGDPVVQELPVFQSAGVEVKNLYGVGAAVAQAGDAYGCDDASQSDRLITAFQGKFHRGSQSQRVAVIQKDDHIVLCQQRGDALVLGLTGGYPHRLGIEHFDSFSVAVPSVHQEHSHGEKIEVADDPEEQDHQTDRLRGIEDYYYPDNSRQGEGDQDQEGRHGADIPGLLSALCGFVSHLESGQGKAHSSFHALSRRRQMRTWRDVPDYRPMKRCCAKNRYTEKHCRNSGITAEIVFLEIAENGFPYFTCHAERLV